MGRQIEIMLVWLILNVLVSDSSANGLIFYPPKPSYTDTSNIIKIEVENNQSISAIYEPNSTSRYILLISHGNAEDIGQNQQFFKLCQKNGWGVFAYDYRGYGTSDGNPSELGTYKDVLAAYGYLVEVLQQDPGNIIVYGRSLGSGPSCYLATRKPIGGLILESPFTSILGVALGFCLPFDLYNNLARIKDIHCPVLVIHGRDDQVVPFWHGQTLYNAANEPKYYYWVEHAGHNDLVYQAGQNYWKALQQFKEQLENTDKTERRLP